MKVRMYNNDTQRSKYYLVKDIDFVKGETVLVLDDGQLLTFDSDKWQSYIFA